MPLMENERFRALIEQAQRGDQEAVQSLVSEFEPRVLRGACRI